MIKYICDICDRETDEGNMRYLHIANRKADICKECNERLIKYARAGLSANCPLCQCQIFSEEWKEIERARKE